MSAQIVITCDRCGGVVCSTSTSLLELRHGQHRLRKPVDLCTRCFSDFEEFIAAGAEHAT